MVDIGRRELITLLGSAAAAWPLVARAQQDAKIARIGFLGLAPASVFITRLDALRAGLREVGQIEGKNIEIEFRWADSVDQLPQLAAELVHMNVDIIFAPASTFVEPARQAIDHPHRIRQPCRPTRYWARSDLGASWWEHHRVVGAYDRPSR
jgi:hypothetical protein